MRAGELIFDTDPEYPSLYAEFEKTMKLVEISGIEPLTS